MHPLLAKGVCGYSIEVSGSSVGLVLLYIADFQSRLNKMETLEDQPDQDAVVDREADPKRRPTKRGPLLDVCGHDAVLVGDVDPFASVDMLFFKCAKSFMTKWSNGG